MVQISDRFGHTVLDGPDSTLPFTVAAIKPTATNTVVVTSGVSQTASGGMVTVTNIEVGGA